jgi:hypothetical protein
VREAEVIKSFNPYAEDTLTKLKHHYLNPVKRFMSSPKGKMVGIGALGATGIGLLGYLGSRRTPQPEQYQLSPQQQMMMQQQMYGMQPKMGASTEAYNRVTIPKPSPLPRTPAPTPSVAGIAKIQRDPSAIGGFSKPKSEPGVDSSKPLKTTTAAEKIAFDPAIATLLAGGAGGLGGYMAGKHLVDPLLEGKESDIMREIAAKQKSLGNVKTLRKFTPIGMAALGAVALAAIAASKARHDERSKMQVQQMLAGHLREYDQTGAGFGAADQVPMGASYEQAYD